MNLHEAEWIAGELIAFTAASIGITWAWLRHQETPPDDPERPEMTEFSSLNDD